MNEQQILEDLVSILETNGIEVRQEPLEDNTGGLCVVQGKRIFFLNLHASSVDSACLCANAVCQIINIEQMYMRPQVRQFIEFNCSSI